MIATQHASHTYTHTPADTHAADGRQHDIEAGLDGVMQRLMMVNYKIKAAVRLRIETSDGESVEIRGRLGQLPASILVDFVYAAGVNRYTIVLHDDYHAFSRYEASPVQVFMAVKEALSKVGTYAADAYFGQQTMSQLQEFFTTEELSFVGILAIGDPTVGNTSSNLARRLFRVLKREQIELEKWKAFYSTILTPKFPTIANQVEAVNLVMKLCMEDMTPTAAQTAYGSQDIKGKDSSARHRRVKELEEYKSCDSMPQLKLDESPLSKFDSGGPSIQYRVESMTPGHKNSKFNSSSKFNIRRGSVRSTRLTLIKKEEELEQALEDSMESDDNESEIEELVNDLKWHYSEAMEDLLKSKEYLTHHYGHQQSSTIKFLARRLDPALLDCLSIALINENFSFVNKQVFQGLIKECSLAREQLEDHTDFDTLKLYALSSIRVIGQQGLISASSCNSFEKKANSEIELLLDYCQLLVAFCQDHNLHLFIQTASVLLE